jgi:hypothetical protein
MSGADASQGEVWHRFLVCIRIKSSGVNSSPLNNLTANPFPRRKGEQLDAGEFRISDARRVSIV